MDRRCARVVRLLFLIVLHADCARGGGPQSPDDEPTIDSGAVAEAVSRLSRVDGMRSLLVARHGDVVVEEYFNGTGPADAHDVRSVTKSVTSMLIGIAIAQGAVRGLDATLAEYLVGRVVDSLDPVRAAIRVEHLLTMTAGFEWHQMPDGPDFENWVAAEDQVLFVLDRSVVDSPGSRFNYSDGVAHLLSVILTEATGMAAEEFAARYLFEPLGLGRRAWVRRSGGYNSGGVGLQITPRDMLVLGQLYLDGGVHDGLEIVPAAWVRTSTESHVSTGGVMPFGAAYGYLWWVGDGAAHPYYFATGYGGQFIVVVPDLEMVVTASCDWWGVVQADTHWYDIMSTIVQVVIPAAR